MIGPKQSLTLLLLVCSLAVPVVDSFTSSSSSNIIKKSLHHHHRSSTAAMMMSSKKEEIELPPPETLDKLLTVAIDASKQAGEIILGNSGGADVLKLKANSRDLLTLIDPLCEKVRESRERNIIFLTTQF